MATEQLELDPERTERLKQLAEKVHRPSDELLQEAVDNYLDVQVWQIEDIRKGLAEADAGDFATQEETQALNKKYGFD